MPENGSKHTFIQTVIYLLKKYTLEKRAKYT